MYRHILSGLQNHGKTTGDGASFQPKLPVDLSQKYPLNILVAEDNLVNQQVIIYILEKLGYTPRVVGNGQEAVNAAGQDPFDIIFMDLQMPEMDGLEATRLIRKAPLPDQPVIIALTANTMQGDEEECLSVGMNDYIGKPVNLDELVGKLQKWANYRKAS